jgi:hypothetical protein
MKDNKNKERPVLVLLIIYLLVLGLLLVHSLSDL